MANVKRIEQKIVTGYTVELSPIEFKDIARALGNSTSSFGLYELFYKQLRRDGVKSY